MPRQGFTLCLAEGLLIRLRLRRGSKISGKKDCCITFKASTQYSSVYQLTNLVNVIRLHSHSRTCAFPLMMEGYSAIPFAPAVAGTKLFRVSGFEPDPTSIVSPSSFVALPLGAFLRQAVALFDLRTLLSSPATPISPLNLKWVGEIYCVSRIELRDSPS